MSKDERIIDERTIGTSNRYFARGFGIWYCLLLIALLYRQFVLNQKIQDHWDILVIFFLGTAYVSYNLVSHGVYAGNIKARTIAMCSGIIIGISAVNYLTGRITSLFELGSILGSILGLSLIVTLILYLNYRWKKKNELIDQ